MSLEFEISFWRRLNVIVCMLNCHEDDITETTAHLTPNELMGLSAQATDCAGIAFRDGQEELSVRFYALAFHLQHLGERRASERGT